ncbi:hypothetical protein M409DRAFT_55694 [Zasmidium cellare ATCC 36951]|uniref:Uncharacterized protein n=1 Tax=Zasmidium cellare ATCC 36951 TaxID=1080233 RepID=A0A6A6CF43_ZASCE|nr:uncharacterized protein M409DRAFT_55694 [Zasmidium cellare ATCC 36951]KAF2165834.1 hypothetical protein M409DRAFT_55694 [Zasmidium cellare ATCC 36951]
MLEFVHVSGSSGGKDLQTRRKVRSQAMRDFRRRQREEREAGKPGAKPHGKRLSVPHSRSVSPAWPGRERATSTSSMSTEASSSRRHSSRSAASPRPMPFVSQKDGESSFQAMHISQPSSTTQFDMSAVDAMENWQLDPKSTQMDSLSAYWQPAMTGEPSPSNVTQEQATWLNDSDDFFGSTAQIGQMLGFCRSYLHWLLPGVETKTAGKMLGQAWDQSQCPMLLAACCLASVGHLDAVQPNRPPGNYEVYKANVLRHISRRMQSPDLATTDETVGALACLLSFEMSKGSTEALTHLQGLQSVIALKGGLDKLQLQGVPMMIKTLDLLYAVLFDSEPILINSQTLKATNTSSSESPSDFDAFAKLIPILVAEQEALQQSNQVLHAEQLEGLPMILQNASSCLQADSNNSSSHPTTDSEATETFRAGLVAFGQHACMEDQLNPDSIHLGRCCYFTLSTLFNVIVNKAPHRHAKNQKLVEHVFDAIQRVKNSTWASIPYLRLLVLLSAAVTTNAQHMKSFFKAELVRSIYQMGVDEWKRIETFVVRFLEMKRVLERPERRSSAPMEMDVSTMVPASPVVAQPWQISQGRGSTSLRPDGVNSSTAYEANICAVGGTNLPSSDITAKAVPASTVAAGSLLSTPFEENIDPFLRFGTTEEY